MRPPVPGLFYGPPLAGFRAIRRANGERLRGLFVRTASCIRSRNGIGKRAGQTAELCSLFPHTSPDHRAWIDQALSGESVAAKLKRAALYCSQPVNDQYRRIV
jgi:hypothetical protein